ncbi:hypothetical protein TNCV_3098681 [Trichonephila clavipes]|nr:hypothetical protein TNCV_3098681 [Trichonephila clavipes]
MTIVFVWRPRGERLYPVFALQRHTAPTAGVMSLNLERESEMSRQMPDGTSKWEIDDPHQDNGTKLLYCHRSWWTSEEHIELI